MRIDLDNIIRISAVKSRSRRRFLAQTYLGEHNARFAVAAAEEGSAFVPFVGDLDNILCAKHERVLGNNTCDRFEGPSPRIPKWRHRRHFVRVTVRARRYANGALEIFQGPRQLAGYSPDGCLTQDENHPRSAV